MTMSGIDEGLEQDNDIFDYQEEVIEGTKPDDVQEDDIFSEDIQDENKNTLVTQLLQSKGITDSKLKMLDEEDNEIEVDFYSLPIEEQLQILNAEDPEEEPKDNSYELSDSEQEFIKHLRDEQMTLDQYLEKYKEVAISEVGAGDNTSYDTDSYNDQELFLLDLKSKYDLSDEELTKELEKELQDEELFKKKVGKLREDYKKLEDDYNAEQQTKAERDREEQYGKFVDTMVNVAVNNSDFYGIELEDEEKNEVLSYLLELDDQGTSEFYRQLSSPEKLYEAAWFLKYGKEAFDALRDAYESEIKELKKDTPDETKGKAKVIVKPEETQKRKIKSIYDLN